jgi:integrase/recombinase XerD
MRNCRQVIFADFMLTIFRRHLKCCEHRAEGRKYRRCKCPLWVDGFLNGVELRETLGIRDWEKGQQIVREWETGEGQETLTAEDAPVTVKQAHEDFVADAQARNLKERTVYKFQLLFRRLDAFAEEHGIRFLKELDTARLRKFRASWKDGELAAVKNLERMRSFFRFALENGWLERNPTTGIKNPKVNPRPTLPYSRDEMFRLLETATQNIHTIQAQGRENAQRLRGLILLLRYSGLRIGDAVGCQVEKLNDGKLCLYTQKTGTYVHCPLPEFVVRELDSIPRSHPSYWFWNGTSRIKTAVTSWQERLVNLSAKAKVQNGHAHRFRDTFAVELLLQGIPLERVSILLGHQSVKVTERHYSPWIRERQEQAEADVRRTWVQDPIVLLAAKGTRQVREENARPN